MTSTQQQAILKNSACEVTFDNLTRQLYATDASLYQLEPAAVAFPRQAAQASAIIQAAAEAGLSVIPRGAGTGLVGGALGNGVVVDFSRYNHEISELDLEARTVRVGPGVVLDQLNRFLKPHGFAFGPDVATSSRATLGGMLANNSSGSHTPYYGTTSDHVLEMELVTATGGVVSIGAEHDTLRRQRELLSDLLALHQLEITERMPADLLKRNPGYALESCLRDPGNLLPLLCGSEGTLAAITSAVLKIVPLPKHKRLALVFFDSMEAAMQATVELLDLKPAAIEHIDRLVLDRTKGQREFQAARDLLELDTRPCQSILAVEFFDAEDGQAEAVAARHLGSRTLLLPKPADAALVWNLRKAGLSLLTGCPGAAKPVTCIEDAAVRPRDLPAYVAGLKTILGSRGLEASFYGHAASGLLHVRPVLDLHTADGVRKLREVAEEVSSLVRQFKGSLAAEHGVGIARSEFMTEQLGENLLGAMRQLKVAFDPANLFNPGKILPDPRFRLDKDLRLGAGYELKIPFEPILAFAAKDGSFVGNLEQCNGCGGCRKQTAVMCPTFIATGLEMMSTRGRANAIRSALEGRTQGAAEPLFSAELDEALSNCLSCKACTTECPSNVNLSLLKAELLHARIRRRGLSWRERMVSSVDLMGRLGCMVPGLANATIGTPWVRRLLAQAFGLAEQRPLPPYARQRFDRWFKRRGAGKAGQRGKVILWDDTFVRYHEPGIGIAAVKVLEAAGFEVLLAQGRKCCGRPAFSQGNLDYAAELGRHNLNLLATMPASLPILFLEPSCFSMFAEDYRELKLAGSEPIASRCFLFEEFIENLLAVAPEALSFNSAPGEVVIHGHCHAKALREPALPARLARRLSNRKVTLLDSACCGMAGAFGMLESKYALSVRVAEPLVQALRGHSPDAVVVASGTSCRHQLSHLTGSQPWHIAELLAHALREH